MEAQEMARALRVEYAGAFYHVASRGNERKNVFLSARDREQFLSYLESATARYGACIHLYCLMSNHYHLLVETPLGNLSQIMGHINGEYTTYFNVKRRRSGHLFQGRYKAIIVDKDEYGLAPYGVGESAVTQASRRAAESMKHNQSMRNSVEISENVLRMSRV